MAVGAVNTELLCMIGSVAVGTAALTWFMSNQFSQTRRMFYRIISQHNREDDDRFALLEDSIWAIHMRNAKRDGIEPPKRRHIPRRRYLIEDGGDLQPEEAQSG